MGPARLHGSRRVDHEDGGTQIVRADRPGARESSLIELVDVNDRRAVRNNLRSVPRDEPETQTIRERVWLLRQAVRRL
jgi:hypothetical protein